MPVPEATLPILRPLARDEAYEKLREWIITGTLRPGEILRDQEVAQSLGVSRTPVREALRRLEDEGFVETALNRWTRVTPLDLGLAIETYSIIEALEVLALERASFTTRDLSTMRDANEAMGRAIQGKKAAAALRADEAFHEVWLVRAGNRELWALVTQLKIKLRRVELAYWGQAARANRSFQEHARILRALQRGSRRESIAALRQNWEGARQRLQTVAENEGEATTIPGVGAKE